MKLPLELLKSCGEMDPCPLWVLLLKKFSIGKLSAIEVQELASAAVKSGLESQCVGKLAELGACGHSPGNCHRGLVRKYFRFLEAPDPWEVYGPLAVKKGGHRVEQVTAIHLLLPHHWVLQAEENNFLKSLCCKDEELVAFWKSQSSCPQMTAELKKVIETSQPSQLPVPYLLHGDAAPFTEVDSIQVLSFRLGFLSCFGLDSPCLHVHLGCYVLPHWAG